MNQLFNDTCSYTASSRHQLHVLHNTIQDIMTNHNTINVAELEIVDDIFQVIQDHRSVGRGFEFLSVQYHNGTIMVELVLNITVHYEPEQMHHLGELERMQPICIFRGTA